MESKHTKGPWVVNLDTDLNQVVIDSNEHSICAMDCPLHVTEGNANLIASSPEMLEALKECAIDIKELLMAIGPEDELPIDQDLRVAEYPLMIILKALIKRAEGGNT